MADFNGLLRSVSGPPAVTSCLIAASCLVYGIMAARAKQLGNFTLQDLLSWGANFGPLTVNGQWWRLLTALFVHLNLMHLLSNMWGLWGLGRLTERLYGRTSFFTIYLLGGALASLCSVAWNPAISSVGASGAVFAVMGALLAYLTRHRRLLPPSIAFKHWLSTLVFAGYNLVTASALPGIDNAAHVGGLLAGFGLGLLLAVRLDSEARSRWPAKQLATATASAGGIFLIALWQVRGLGSQLTVPERFFQTHADYARNEQRNLQLWNELGNEIAAGTISVEQARQRFDTEIVPFWRDQREALRVDSEKLRGADRNYEALLAQFADLRFQWATAVGDALARNDGSYSELRRLAVRTDEVQADLERIAVRAVMEHRPRALSASPIVRRIRQRVAGFHCVEAPAFYGHKVSGADSKSDAPALRVALGCQAQQQFLAGDYRGLENSLQRALARLGDLPDGGSSYSAIFAGLDDLFEYGNLSEEAALGDTADWRRSVPDATQSDLVEAAYYRTLAWTARGHDVAKAVSAQNFATFEHRGRIAAAQLAAIADRAKDNPQWYVLSILVGLDQSKDNSDLRAVFDEAVAHSPAYTSLYGAMLRTLMPRWGGSVDQADRFIETMEAKFPLQAKYARYTQLYSMYARMEGDDFNVFRESPAAWSGMRMGYLGLLRQFPDSDFLVNDFARFACIAEDKGQYGALRPQLTRRQSASAWSNKYSPETCDKAMQALNHQSGVPIEGSSLPAKLAIFSGVRLGSTPNEVLRAKGDPSTRTTNIWRYDDSKLEARGHLIVAFSGPTDSPSSKVQAVMYSGDAAAAPSELPYMIDDTSVTVLSIYGRQTSGNLTLHGRMNYTFKNGLYVATQEEKVVAYGIYTGH